MSHEQWGRSSAFAYVLTADESLHWKGASEQERLGFLRELASRLYREACEHGCGSFVIFDRDGSPVAEGDCTPHPWPAYDPAASPLADRMN